MRLETLHFAIISLGRYGGTQSFQAYKLCKSIGPVFEAEYGNRLSDSPAIYVDNHLRKLYKIFSIQNWRVPHVIIKYTLPY